MRMKRNNKNAQQNDYNMWSYRPKRGFASDFEVEKEMEREEERENRGRISRRERILDETLY